MTIHCIPKYILDKFYKALKTGAITPQKLQNMTSEQRVKTFSEIFGMDNAREINLMFEQKMILKNQQRGMISWVKKIKGINDRRRADIISKIQKMDTILTPETKQEFYSDLVEHKLGVAVTMDEAASIADLSKKISQAKQKMTEEMADDAPEVREWAKATLDLKKYYDAIKLESKKKGWEWALPKNWLKGIAELSGINKALKASLDFSVLLRQGIKTLYNYPDIWLKNSAKSFMDFWETVVKGKGDDVEDAVKLDIMSRKNYRNGVYDKYKLAVGVMEEAYPSSLPEKIPGIGRIFKGSELAFSLWSLRTRADIFDRLYEMGEKNGEYLDGLGEFVNSLTGRGGLGRAEGIADFLNKMFFAPRFFKANLDAATIGLVSFGGRSSFVRRQAAKTYLKYIGYTTAILGLIVAFQDPDDPIVELDPRSSDFGKIKVGNTRFDISGGVLPIYVLAARLVSKQTKSSTTGIIKEIGGEFGQQSFGDVMANFVEGKLAPFATTLLNLYRGYDFSGKKTSVSKLVSDLIVPIPVQNAFENLDKEQFSIYLAGIISDALGIGSTTYSAEEDWNTKNTTEMIELKKSVGQKRFDKMNKEFNDKYSKWLEKTRRSASYRKMTDEEKLKYITKNKKIIKDIVKNGF